MRCGLVPLVGLLLVPLVLAAPVTRSFTYEGSAATSGFGACFRYFENEWMRYGGIPSSVPRIPAEPWSVCWTLVPTATTLVLRLDDVAPLATAGYYEFYTASFLPDPSCDPYDPYSYCDEEYQSGEPMGAYEFCGETTVYVPYGAWAVEVAPLPPGLVAGCDPGAATVPTTGKIFLTMT
jgi:hypothetical protein